MLIPDEFPKNERNSGGTTYGWTVEARYKGLTPKLAGEQIFDEKWRKIEFYKSPIGLPTGSDSPMEVYASILGYYPYETAQALRWWFLAVNYTYCWETRLIKHEVKHSISSKEVSAHDFIGNMEE